ncbi:MAG TPA: HNH endonuclease [Phycisphaerae bacterium]|nr:HNH endonuclease [Phycisphaerae bacterium]
MNSAYESIAERAAFRCEYCHAPAALFNSRFEVEHIVPASRAGDDSPANLALSCRACNLFKGAAIAGVDSESNVEVELFHPRRHHWEDHFRFDAERTELVGASPIGRATAARLRFNHPMQIRARREWMRLGQFP